jgi:hypothetical protein
MRAESLIKGKRGPSPLRTFFVLECLDALENATLAQQRLAGAAFKLACDYTKKDTPSLRKRCYKAGLRTVLNLAESTTPASPLHQERQPRACAVARALFSISWKSFLRTNHSNSVVF